MKIEELKNYGKSYAETMPHLPPAVQKLIKKASFGVVRKHMGLFGSLRFLMLAWREGKRLGTVDLTPVKEKGLDSKPFIQQMIQTTALFSAMKEMTGMEKARDVFYEIMDNVSCPMNEAILPSVEDLEETQNGFKAFRDYLMAFFEAEKKDGLHEYDLVEDSDAAFAITVTYCAFCEIPRLCGIVEACDPSCYSDEVFFPGYLQPLGIRFLRTKTLARGGDCCDFRFEKVQG
ncbi:MAG: L-2-amino-thiazoline-4-carboxylic acid hydrolase [Pseudomonadota bacterium]